MLITEQQQKRLVWNVKKWARMLDESLRTLSQRAERFASVAPQLGKKLSPVQVMEARALAFGAPADAHMIVISLRQLDEFARALVASNLWCGDVAQKGNDFRKLVNSTKVRDLRDVLEHGADYILGKGNKPELMLDPDGDYPSVLMSNGKVVRITVFGRSYDITNVVLAGIDLAKVLPPA
jgi:hypothetical protein